MLALVDEKVALVVMAAIVITMVMDVGMEVEIVMAMMMVDVVSAVSLDNCSMLQLFMVPKFTT